MTSVPRSTGIPPGAALVAAVTILLATGCIPGRGGPTDDDVATPTSSADPALDPTTTAAGGTFIVDMVENPVICDGTDRPSVKILGAQPFEQLDFRSTGDVVVPQGIADDDGDYTLRWSCPVGEAGASWDITATGATSGRTASFTIESFTPDDAALTISGLAPNVACDDNQRQLGIIEGAEPGETIGFQSPQATDVTPGQADADGRLVVQWRCIPAQSGTTWNILATGQESGRRVQFSFTGVTTVETEVAAELVENPFVCDDGTRPVATLSGLAPGEFVDFTSPEATGLREGRADDEGGLTVRWQCSADDVGKTWNVQAVGRTSGRGITMTFTGAAPELTAPDLEIEMTENPFACDGTSRPFAVISNLVSGEFVDFTSPQATALSQGQADGDGRLPVRWQCNADGVGKTWEITATGGTSGLAITFSLTGAAPPAG